MRIAIVSDIHANRYALDAAVETLEAKGFDEIWSPGDFVNYGADPEYIVAWARNHVIHAVMGNHDAVIVKKETPDNFNMYARNTIPYTRDQLSKQSLEWLKQLPYEKVVAGIRLVHASPSVPGLWTYIMGRDRALSMLEDIEEQVCLFGHTHVQVIYDSEGNQFFEGTISLLPDRKYLINPGSVGQPRDGDHRWACALYDTEEHTVELLRGTYDIDKAATDIFRAGLPEKLGYRLYQGQ